MFMELHNIIAMKVLGRGFRMKDYYLSIQCDEDNKEKIAFHKRCQLGGYRLVQMTSILCNQSKKRHRHFPKHWKMVINLPLRENSVADLGGGGRTRRTPPPPKIRKKKIKQKLFFFFKVC